MKKLLFLCSMLVCCLSAFSQISFTVSATTITSGQEVTITSTGENHSIAIGNKYITNVDYFSVVSANPSTIGQSISLTSVSYSTSSSPTIIKVKPKNTSSGPATVTYKFSVDTYDNWALHTIPPFDYQFTLTVNPAPSIFYNVAKSGVYYKQSCAAGTQAQPYTYTVPANTYSSTISQADADSKAQLDVNNNGQTKANQLGVCAIVYSSAAITGTFSRNNCSVPKVGGPAVSYTLAAGAKTSIISQADANAQALVLFNTNGQANANATGTCVYGNTIAINYTNQAYSGSHISRLRVKNSSGTVLYNFTESQLLAGQLISTGTYTFEFTTVGPIANGTVGWADFRMNLLEPVVTFYEAYNDGTTTVYSFANVNASNSHVINIFLDPIAY
jgi:hypothetical protein